MRHKRQPHKESSVRLSGILHIPSLVPSPLLNEVTGKVRTGTAPFNFFSVSAEALHVSVRGGGGCSCRGASWGSNEQTGCAVKGGGP